MNVKLTLQESLLLQEARRADLKYIEKQASGKLDRVITELEGAESGTMSKLAGKYKRLEQALKRMTATRDELKTKLKTDVAELFEPEELVLTRVVETVSFTLTLSKAPVSKEKTEIDYKAISEALAKLIPNDLEAKVKEITDAYTKVIAGGKFSSPSIDVDHKLAEGAISQALLYVVGKFKTLIKTLQKSISSWAVDYDKRLGALKKQAQIV